MTFEQKQIPHVWIELHLPPATDANGEPDFAISPRHLHIWPRQEFMLIALPNKVWTTSDPTDVIFPAKLTHLSFP